MTDPAELAHEVLLRVAAFVRTLPADQLADLASGAAKLELVPKGGRAARPATRAAAPLSRPVAEIEATLGQLSTRQAAAQYVNDLGLKVAELRELAGALGVAVPGRATKAAITTAIAEATAGRRLDSAAITGQG